jgi:uncharacterized MnhB-related membrane protein
MNSLRAEIIMFVFTVLSPKVVIKRVLIQSPLFNIIVTSSWGLEVVLKLYVFKKFLLGAGGSCL